MSSSLFTGASGLIAHQRLLDVVGHNIANVNTTGYKSQRALFSDVFYETLSPSASPIEGGIGGTNSSQIGQGVQVSHIDRNFGTGPIEATGGHFDMAIEGDGFFVVNDGINNFYTRAGAFTLDANGVLVTPGGLQVQRLPLVGEPSATSIGFQEPGNSQIRIPQNALIPGEPSREINISGNFSASVTAPSSTIKTTVTPMETSEGLVTETSLLNDLESNQANYVAGDRIHIEGIDVDGSDIDVTLDVSETTTIGEIVAAINDAADGFQATLRDGNILLVANDFGATDFVITMRDEPSNQGITSFSRHGFILSTPGTIEGSVPLTTRVIDPRGTEHEITLFFERVSDDDWRMTASIDPSLGTIQDNVIEPIQFNDDGTFRTTGESSIALNLNGFGELQFLRISFDAPDSLQTPSNQGNAQTAGATADGHLPGTLITTAINSDGRVIGIDSNGREVTIAQLAVASFHNTKGLDGVRDGLFLSGLNSGDPDIGVAGTGRRGKVLSGHLESSNVDVAFEFTRLIVAQRGFSANARTITVSDEVLEELTNIVR